MKKLVIYLIFIIGLVNSLPLSEEDDDIQPIQPRATVCYDELIGCFSNEAPWDNALGTLPIDPTDLKTEFLLFTRENPLQEQLLHYRDPESIRSSLFNTQLPLKIIIHGFDNTRETRWLHTMKRTILDADNVNVMIVGWGNGSAFPLYNNATANIRLVGRELGLLVNLIRSVLFPTNPKSLNIHCIGHSLGAHTCAYASNNAQIKFNRISGMDPAGPSFEETNPIIRVDPTDADFVDIMHTNGGSILSASFGITMSCGHVDFFVNGGKNQPGCPTGLFGALDPNGDSSCSHSRAYQFYTESISSKCPFTSYTCYSEASWNRGECTTCANNKCAVMGYRADKYPGRGSVYLATNAQSPYCGHHHIFELTMASDALKTAGEIAISFNSTSSIDKAYKPLTTNDDVFNAGNIVKRIFVTVNDLVNVNDFQMKFNKKPKPLIGQDTNSAILKFAEIQVHSVDLRESYVECPPSVRSLETNKTIQINLKYKC